MHKKLKVAMIGDFPRSPDEVGGGVESVMLYLAAGLSGSQNFSLDVVTLDRWGLGERRLDAGGYTAHYISGSRVRSGLKTVLNARRMAARLRQLNPDLVHAHIAGHYSDAARRSGLPWLLTLHGIRFLEADLRTGWLNRTYRNRMVKREETRNVRTAPYVISINPFVEETLGKYLTGQIARIENPVDDSFFRIPQENVPFSLLHVGRLTPRKDLLTLLEAFRRLHEQHPEATLRLAGACDPGDPQGYFEKLKSFANERQLEDHVIFLGLTDRAQLQREISRASVVVLSAVLETAPMAITESLSAATAVVTTDAGGARHLIREGRTGCVVPCRDPARFADALIEVLDGDGRAIEMGEAGRREAERRWRIAGITAQTLATYRDALREAASPTEYDLASEVDGP